MSDGDESVMQSERPLKVEDGAGGDVSPDWHDFASVRSILDAIPDAVLVVDAGHTVVFANEIAGELFGCQSLLGICVDDLVAPSHRTKHVEFRTGYFENPIARKMGDRQDILVLRRDGSEFPGEVALRPFPSVDKRFAVCIVRDVTDKKLQDEKLKRNIRALMVLSECNRALIHATDSKALKNDVCRIIVEHGGYLLAWVGLAGQGVKKPVIPAAKYGEDDGYVDSAKISWGDNKFGIGPTGIAIRTGTPAIARFISSEREFAPWRAAALARGYLSSVALPLSSKSGVFGALMIYAGEPDAFDVEELELLEELANDLSYGIETLRVQAAEKAAKAELKESEARLSNLLATAPFGVHVYRLDEDGDLIFVDANPAADKMLGTDHKTQFGRTLLAAWPDLLGTAAPDMLAKVARDGINWHTERLVYEDEKVKGAFLVYAFQTARNVAAVFFFDDTERRTTLDDLAREREIQLLAEEAAGIGNWEWNLKTGRARWSSSIFRAFGVEDSGEGLGLDDVTKLVHPEDKDRLTAEVNRAIRDKTKYECSYRIIRPGGGERMIAATGKVFCSAQGDPVRMVGTLRDVTEQTKLEAQFKQAQKLEAIGRLTGGIAHDFNNLLTGIIGFSELVLDKLPPGDPIRQDVEEIKETGLRAAELTSRLLTFSRKQPMSPASVNVNEMLKSLAKLLRRVIGEHIELVLIAEPLLGTIYADPAQIEQVIMNLAVNARDAMPGGGKLIIETNNVIWDAEFVSAHPWAQVGSFVQVSVADDGCGMSHDVLDHVFEPFFTTKGPDKGTGLGLATVYGIIKQHEGLLHVYSEIDNGTVFKIYLPVVEGAASAIESTLEKTAVCGSETILVAEDNEPVRRLARRTLESAGYTVLEACDGAEAVSIMRESGGRIDMVLIDVVMPKLDGFAAYDAIKKIRPDVKVVFSSGYSGEMAAVSKVHDLGARIVQKPYKSQHLLATVREVLDSQPV